MERLQKVIAHAGVASRRKAEEMIQEGKVKVNGTIVRELGVKVGSNDTVEVNGIQLEKEEPVYFLFYKPKAVLSAASDDKGRRTIKDFFGQIEQRIYPVGRLDYDTSGILVVTNDGEFANLLMHPKYEIEKTYIAKVKGTPQKEQVRLLEKGVELEDGKTAPAKVKVLSVDSHKGTSLVEITIHEGRNHQVKRMFDAIQTPVMKLKRERFAFLTLYGLAPGDFRVLNPKEVKQLRAMTISR